MSPVPGTSSIKGLERHRSAGFTVAILNLGDSDRPLDHLLTLAAFFREWLGDHSDRFTLLRNVADIGRAREEDKLAVAFDVEGAFSVGDRLETVSLLYDAGVRWMSFVYNRRNLAGSGVHDQTDEGLTQLGVALTEEMDQVGMIKCLSHTGYRTAMDVLTASAKPCIFSHSNALALKNHARNIPDELIKACAATEGVVCINGINIFLGDAGPDPRLMVRHIDYVSQLVGVDHVGLGFDYGYNSQDELAGLLSDPSFWPDGNEYDKPIECVPPWAVIDIVDGLEELGYSESDVAGVLGGNMHRVASAVWR